MARLVVSLLVTGLLCSCLADPQHVMDGASCIAEGCSPKTKWDVDKMPAEMYDEKHDEIAMQMLQMTSSNKNLQKAQTGVQPSRVHKSQNVGSSEMDLAEITMVGVDQMAGCTATFRFQTSNLVVKEAIAKQFGYHFGDLASTQDFNGLSSDVKSLNVVGCCEVSVYTGLNFQGTSETYKQGAHTNVMQDILSIRFEPGVCLSPMWKKLEAKCQKYEDIDLAKMKAKAQIDNRKCTLQKFGVGDCRDKDNTGNHPWYCTATVQGELKELFSEDFCQKSCVEMKGIALAQQTSPDGKLSACRCYFTGPRTSSRNSGRGPPCPCGWKSDHGWPQKGVYRSSKRGDIIAAPKMGYRSTCAVITCDGPEPASGPTPAPAPLSGIFAKFPKCENSLQGQDQFKTMQQMMKDKRKCTVQKMEDGQCRDKSNKYNNPSSCIAAEFKPANAETCKQACLEMKAISVGVSYRTNHAGKPTDKLAGCYCFLPNGPTYGGMASPTRQDYEKKEEGPRSCPCGWKSMHGWPVDGGPEIRGEVHAGYPGVGHHCAPIACEGPEPPWPLPVEQDPWW